MYKLTVLLLTLVALSYAVKYTQLDSYSFSHFKAEFARDYETTEEHNLRQELFNRRLFEIRQHNSDPSKTWKMGINHLADRTDEEIKSLRGLKKGQISKYAVKSTQSYENIDISKYEQAPIDWRNHGVITAVKDQGQCGSCWTFAASETLESYWALKHGQLSDLSEQQILDCTPNPDQCGGTGGCQGGTVELAYTELVKRGGLASEWTYPYTSYTGSNFQCHINGNTPPFAKVSGHVNLPSNEYAPLLQHIATTGPLAISVDASAWSFYETGVFDGCNQTNPDIDHAVQLVGIGTDPQYGDYWLVRNSWSSKWGEQGYIRLKRTSTVQCGTDLNPGDGDGCAGGPPTVTVCGTCGILYDTVYPVVV